MELLHCNNCSTNIDGKFLPRSLQFFPKRLTIKHMLASQVSLSFTSVINIEKEKMDTSLHNQAFSINQCHEWKGVFQRKQCTDMSDMMLKQKTLHFQGGPGKPLYSWPLRLSNPCNCRNIFEVISIIAVGFLTTLSGAMPLLWSDISQEGHFITFSTTLNQWQRFRPERQSFLFVCLHHHVPLAPTICSHHKHQPRPCSPALPTASMSSLVPAALLQTCVVTFSSIIHEHLWLPFLILLLLHHFPQSCKVCVPQNVQNGIWICQSLITKPCSLLFLFVYTWLSPAIDMGDRWRSQGLRQSVGV